MGVDNVLQIAHKGTDLLQGGYFVERLHPQKYCTTVQWTLCVAVDPLQFISKWMFRGDLRGYIEKNSDAGRVGQ